MNATQSYNLEKSHKAGSFDFSLCRLESPIGNLSFQRSKWATFRETNVDQIKATFAANPSSVFIMEDRKLLGSSLVVLRKDMFERLTKLIEDLCAGQIGIETELTSIQVASQLALSLAKKQGLVPENAAGLSQKGDLGNALYLLFNSASQISKRNFVQFAVAKKEELVPKLSQDERDSLQDEDD
jgi:hypothetical protein